MAVHNPTKIAEEDLSFLPVTSCYQSVLRASTTGPCQYHWQVPCWTTAVYCVTDSSLTILATIVAADWPGCPVNHDMYWMTYTVIHGHENGAIWVKFAALAALGVVKMTNAASDEIFVIMTTFSFLCISRSDIFVIITITTVIRKIHIWDLHQLLMHLRASLCCASACMFFGIIDLLSISSDPI